MPLIVGVARGYRGRMAVLPTTPLARIGLGVDVVALVAYAAVIGFALRSLERSGVPVAVGWGPPVLAMAIGSGLALAAIVRDGERSLLGWVALVPGAFFLLAVATELVGLVE